MSAVCRASEAPNFVQSILEPQCSAKFLTGGLKTGFASYFYSRWNKILKRSLKIMSKVKILKKYFQKLEVQRGAAPEPPGLQPCSRVR